jgi:hypothetical protein
LLTMIVPEQSPTYLLSDTSILMKFQPLIYCQFFFCCYKNNNYFHS